MNSILFVVIICCQGERGVVETQNEPPPSEFRTFFCCQGERGVVETHAEPPPSINSCAYFLTYLRKTSNPGGGFIKCLNILFCFISTD